MAAATESSDSRNKQSNADGEYYLFQWPAGSSILLPLLTLALLWNDGPSKTTIDITRHRTLTGGLAARGPEQRRPSPLDPSSWESRAIFVYHQPLATSCGVSARCRRCSEMLPIELGSRSLTALKRMMRLFRLFTGCLAVCLSVRLLRLLSSNSRTENYIFS